KELGHQVLEDVGAPIRNGAGYVDFNTKEGSRFSVVHGYLLPALERSNLTLLTGMRVNSLAFSGSRCTGVRLQIGGEQHEVVAEQETVLCAGVVETPRLLMLSGVGDAGEHGAFELAARYSTVNLNDHFVPGVVPPPGSSAVGGGKQTVYAVGLNWYPNRNVRFMFDYLHGDINKRFSTAAGGGLAGAPLRTPLGCRPHS